MRRTFMLGVSFPFRHRHRYPKSATAIGLPFGGIGESGCKFTVATQLYVMFTNILQLDISPGDTHSTPSLIPAVHSITRGGSMLSL